MSISRADLDRAIELERSVPPNDDNELACLGSIAAVIAFVAASARAEGEDEADHAEMVVRLCEMPPDEVQKIERELRALGYTAVCDRLRQIAGKRKRDLKPLQ
jgi:hypothetical protein